MTLDGRDRIAADFLGDGAELLDYGCGSEAPFAVWAASEGRTVYACDIDRQLIERLRATHPSVTFFAVDESKPQLPLPNGQLSAVTCMDVLEHMPARLRLDSLREMRRVLRDDGILVVTTPHKGGLLSFADPENAKFFFPKLHRFVYQLGCGKAQYERIYGRGSGNYSPGAERHEHFTREELRYMLERSGFIADDSTSYTRPIYPLARILLWIVEAVARRTSLAKPVLQLVWRLYAWDANKETPPLLACAIALRARPIVE